MSLINSSQNTQLIDGNRQDMVGYQSLETNIEDNDDSEEYTKLSIGGYSKSIIFGGLDGLYTSTAIICASFGGDINCDIVLLIGVSLIIANSIGLGVQEFLSSRAHQEYIHAIKRKSKWDFKYSKNIEIKEMIRKFEQKGMNNSDADLIVNKLSQYEDFFVNLIVSNDLGLQISDDSDAYLITDSFFLGLSYVFFGILPIIIYSFGYFDIKLLTFSNDNIFYISMLITLVLLFALGSVKSSFSMVSFWCTGLESLLIGLLYGSIAYILSSTINNFVSF